MAVSFRAEMSPIKSWALTCSHPNGVTDHDFASYPLVEAFMKTERETHGNLSHLVVCGDDWCLADGMMFSHAIESDPSPEIGVSSTNITHVLEVLGIDVRDESGTMDATAFLGRVMMAQAVSPSDAGIPVTAEKCSGGMTMIGGRRPGYTDEVLAHLRDITDFAIARGRKVVWS